MEWMKAAPETRESWSAMLAAKQKTSCPLNMNWPEIYKVYPYDGKVQVTVEFPSPGRRAVRGEVATPPALRAPSPGRGGKIKTVVARFQNSKSAELLELVKSKIAAVEYLINPAGEWTLGGFEADSGLSGRKIVIDAYGPNVPVGGGSFSGKDFTKVDRSVS